MSDLNPEGPVQGSLFSRMYRGDTRFDVVGRWKAWFAISAAAMVIGVASLVIQGLDLGIEFEGGSVWELPAGEATVAEARNALEPFGLDGATIQTTEDLEGDSGVTMLRVATEEVETDAEVEAVTTALEEATGEDLTRTQQIGPTWGQEITESAREALVVFVVLVAIYIAIRFRAKSAVPIVVALAHDVLVVVSVYSLGQFQVTPGTVVAFLTILGYSLYDSVVVFDRVKENTELVGSGSNLTYSGMVNLTLNQTLMRSINTTVTALLPVASLLIVGSWWMGAAALQDFALALLIGLLVGAYSSFFVAAPLLALLREREPTLRKLRDKAIAEGRSPTEVPDRIKAAAAAGAGRASGAEKASVRSDDAPAGPRTARSAGRETTTTPSGRVITARPRKKGKARSGSGGADGAR